ncbi:MAG: kynureninase [Bacteroidota bacterium]|jgi:kynureninase
METTFSIESSCTDLLEKAFPTPARAQFHIPKVEGKDVHYFCGNSLGLQPTSTAQYIQNELEQWKNLGVEGHFQGDKPWLHYHQFSKKITATLVGAKASEVVMMNSLTTNLHLLLISFYAPTKQKFKIITEAGAFSSDQYALETQVKLHGFHPADVIIELLPRKGEHILNTDDILETITKHGNELALVFLGGVNYFTGQAFDLQKITAAAHQVGAKAGFDLAHAVGNIALQLHDWQVDFAVWCSYKYLNAGPGGVGGAFVHERYANEHLPRLGGWWGHKEEERFLMKKHFQPAAGADGWQLSNAPILPLAAYMASIEIFESIGLDYLFKRSKILTAYLEFLLLNSHFKHHLQIITPSNPEERGSQLSVIFKENGKDIFDFLQKNNIIVDWRSPNVIRISPVALYTTFKDIFVLMETLAKYYRQ